VAVSKTYRAIEEMIGRSLLHTKTARDIVRKSMVTATPASGSVEDLASPNLWGQYSQVTDAQYGSVVAFPGLEYFPFPVSSTGTPTASDPEAPSSASSRLRRWADWIAVDEVRLVVSVTEAGASGSTLFLRIWRDTLWGVGGFAAAQVPFMVSSPEVPLDAVGLHVSEWQQIDWPPEATKPTGFDHAGPVPPFPFELRPAIVLWWVHNPSLSTNSAGIGLVQLQARTASV
jgi:hypothetical protein